MLLIHSFALPIIKPSYDELHEQCLNYITSELETNDSRTTVVVTHHVPTLMHYPAQYKGSAINDAFVIELFDLIETRGPNYWIYGHHHHNHPDFPIGKTQLLTNQLGYVAYGEHKLFDAGKTIRETNIRGIRKQIELFAG